MKPKATCVSWIAFVAALGLGCGCSSSDNNSTPPPTFNLDGRTYTEKYTCNQTFTGMSATCADLNVSDVIAFQITGPYTYVGHDVPDTGFVYNGTLIGTLFNWSATSPNGYSETGTWAFSGNGDSFSGASHYIANDGTYDGDCNETGVFGTGTVPPNPPLVFACP